MAFLEINGTIIHPIDIVSVEEKRVVVKIPVKVNNPEPKPEKGFLAKLMYSDTMEKTVEVTYTVIEIKVKSKVQITTRIDKDTGAISNQNNQTYDFYTICSDEDFLEAMSLANNKEDVELEIGNFYCYPGTLAYANYINTNVIFDADVETKEDFVAKYISNLPVKKDKTESKGTLHTAINAVRNEVEQTSLNGDMLTGDKFICEIATFTKEAGGRHTPFFSYYMPMISFGRSTPSISGTIILPNDVECCNPGDNVRVTIEIKKAIRIIKGARFSIVENGKTIGFGTLIDTVK